MKNQMALIREFKKHNYEVEDGKVPSAKALNENWGVRIRQTKDTREHGLKNEVWEISTSYFYQNQQTTNSLVNNITKFAEENGFQVQTLDPWRGKKVDNTKENLSFQMASWPKTSWAIIWIIITKAS